MAICFVTAENPDPRLSEYFCGHTYASALDFLCSPHLTIFERLEICNFQQPARHDQRFGCLKQACMQPVAGR